MENKEVTLTIYRVYLSPYMSMLNNDKVGQSHRINQLDYKSIERQSEHRMTEKVALHLFD